VAATWGGRKGGADLSLLGGTACSFIDLDLGAQCTHGLGAEAYISSTMGMTIRTPLGREQASCLSLFWKSGSLCVSNSVAKPQSWSCTIFRNC
jgi:hypothetical protein